MLTVHKIQVAVGSRASAMAAAKYPLEVADSPGAFTRPGDAANGVAPERANAMWLGSGEALARLGLERGTEVTAEHLAQALQGRHALDRTQVRRPGSVAAVDRDGQPRLDDEGLPYREAVVNSFDLTFSAPKSVSVLWSQADARLRAQIEQAMVESANAALEHLTQTRPMVAGKAVAHGFAAAAALHVTGRTARGDAVPAPQLHVHVDLVGVTDGNGTLKTPNSQALYKHSAMREGGAVGRARLAEELRKLGFDIDAGTGRGGRYFEVKGVPRGLSDRMSGRTRDVRAWVKAREAQVGGTLSNHQQARGALLTRVSKMALEPALVQGTWDGHAQEFEFGAARIEALRAEPAVDTGADPDAGGKRSVEELCDEVRETILQRIWEEGPTVSMGAARSMAFELAPIGLSLEQVSGVLVGMQASGELIAVDEWRLTTRQIHEQELFVKGVAIREARRSRAGLSTDAVARGIEAAEAALDGTLDPEQRDAVEKLTTGTGWACLTGRAGTGKGPVLQAVAEAHRRDGWQVIACALDGATTQRLGAQIGAPALTVEQFLYRLETGRVRVDSRTLLLIDEASKLGLRHWRTLAEVQADTHGRMIPVGDVGQVGAIECPGMFDVMLEDEAIPSAVLSTVRRHRDPVDPSKSHPWLGDYQKALYAGDSRKAVEILRRERAITMHHTREDAVFALVDKWEQRRRDHEIAAKDAVLIVHGSNADIDKVNALAQDRRLVAGDIGGEGVPAADRDYRIYSGDVVMLRGTAYQPDREGAVDSTRVENGTMGIVDRVDERGEVVWVNFDRPEGGVRRVAVDLGALRRRAEVAGPGARPTPSLRLAYAGHPFPMQGATFSYVGSLWGHPTQRKEATYSGDTRARFWLDVQVDRASVGWEGTDDDRYQRLAKRLETPSHRLASISYEEAPDASIIEGRSRLGTAPELPLRAGDTAIEPVEEAPEVAPDLQLPDPLDRFEMLLGRARLTPIGRQADALAEEMSELDDGVLRAERDRAREAVERLDRPAAREMLRIERDQELIAARIDQARELAVELEAEADRLRGFSARHERDDLMQAAEAQQRAAEHDELALGRLVDRELEIQAEGRHPTEWVREQKETFARGIAAERQLQLQRRLALPEEAEAAGPQREPESPDRDREPDTGPDLDM